MPYCRHPSSAACFPALTGRRLRRQTGARRRKSAADRIEVLPNTRNFGGPPKNRPNLSLLYPQICGQGAYSSCKQVRDLSAQIDVHPCRVLKPQCTLRCSCPTLLGSRSLTCISLASALGCQMAPPATVLSKDKLSFHFLPFPVISFHVQLNVWAIARHHGESAPCTLSPLS